MAGLFRFSIRKNRKWLLYSLGTLICFCVCRAQDVSNPDTGVEKEQTGFASEGLADSKKSLSKSEKQEIYEAWVDRFQGAVRKLKTASADEVSQIETLIRETRDISALKPMIEVLGRETAPIRILLDRSLVGQDKPLAWVLFAERCLIEPDPEVRRTQFRLLQENENKPELEYFFQHVRKAVNSKNPIRAGLGAMLVADMGWEAMLPSLVDQLAPERFVAGVVWVPEPINPRASGLNITSVDGYVVVPIPVVGPGVVAYGQQIVPVGNGLSLGASGKPVSRFTPVVHAGKRVFPNPVVLGSLSRLSGENFGYDVVSWRKWLEFKYRNEALSKKRVPKP